MGTLLRRRALDSQSASPIAYRFSLATRRGSSRSSTQGGGEPPRTSLPRRLPPAEPAPPLGPAICGRGFESSADVREQLTGQPVTGAGHVDLRSLIAEH